MEQKTISVPELEVEKADQTPCWSVTVSFFPDTIFNILIGEHIWI